MPKATTPEKRKPDDSEDLQDGTSQSVQSSRKARRTTDPDGPGHCLSAGSSQNTSAGSTAGSSAGSSKSSRQVQAQTIHDQLLNWYYKKTGIEAKDKDHQLHHLIQLLSKRMAKPVPQSLWITNPAQVDDDAGQSLDVPVLRSQTKVLQQIKDVLQFRSEWLQTQGISDPDDRPFLMPDDPKAKGNRKAFLDFAKKKYHTSDEQREIQRKHQGHKKAKKRFGRRFRART